MDAYTSRGYEVIIMDDPVDEYTTQHLTEYEKRKVKSIAKMDVKLLDTKDKTEKKKMQKLKSMYMRTLNWCKDHVKAKFGAETCIMSQKLRQAPLFVFTSEYGYSAQMEKIQKAQAFTNSEKQPGYMTAKKTVELNPGHPITKKIRDEVGDPEREGKPSNETVAYFDLLIRASLLQSGFALEDPHELAAPLEKLVKIGLGIPKDEPAEKIEFSMSEDDPDSESEDDKKEAEEVKEEADGGDGDPEPEDEEVEDLADNNNEEEGEQVISDEL